MKKTYSELVEAALQVRKNAYAPYSNYKVGAALLCKSGSVFVGANVENASFSAGICAERSAVAAAVSAGETDFEAIAIITESSPPAAPCGVCRQVLAEFNPQITLILANTKGEVRQTRLDRIFKEQFSNSHIKQKG